MGMTSSGGEDSDDEAEEDEAGNETLNTTVTEGTFVRVNIHSERGSSRL